MLEKLGLPPKPALKGNEWVLDASHCQGCTSAFTFFNRKHHCRRCGGIFCGTCTQQKIYLRGQGEGQVRVCDPCKKLEDAARFELRHGPKNKAIKGGNSKSHQDVETDSLLKELLDHDTITEYPAKADRMKDVDEVIGSRKILPTSMGHLAAGMGDANDDTSQSSSVTPESLLLQAQEQKKQWLALKKEGKGDAALQAFKRAKELERQAESLKLEIRRNMRKPTNSTVRKEKREDAGMDQQSKMVDVTLKTTSASRKKTEDKDDITSALKEMGWNDDDLNGGVGKNTSKTVESELAELASSIHHSEGKNRPKPTTSMEVLAHKRRALALKREGNLAEAKEELKKAKLMERQLEEQEIFGTEGDESDDELSALMRGLDKDASMDIVGIADLDLSTISNIGDFDYHDDEEGMEVTDMDINDPEMLAALRSIGWEEDAFTIGKGNAKVSRKDAGSSLDFLDMEQSLDEVEATDDDLKNPHFLAALKSMGLEDDEPSKIMHSVIASMGKQSDKESLQQEISFLKKEALALKRAGKLQEANEELRHAKQLEKALKDSLSGHTEEDIMSAFSVIQERHGNEVEVGFPGSFHIHEDSYVDNVVVTEEDMGDPDLAKTLKSLGWQDDEVETPVFEENEIEPTEEVFYAMHRSKTRPQLQKELLGIKRAALKLRREGKLEEAEEELKKAQVIERLMEESLAVPKRLNEQKINVVEENAKVSEEENNKIPQDASSDQGMVTLSDFGNIELGKQLSSEYDDKMHGGVGVTGRETSWDSEPHNSASLRWTSNYPDDTHKDIVHDGIPAIGLNGSFDFSEMRQGKGESVNDKVMSVQSSGSVGPNLQQEILALKRKALIFKREGKLAEAKEQLREAKVLEKKLDLEQSCLDNPVIEAERSEPTPSEPSPEKASLIGGHMRETSSVRSSHGNAEKHVIAKDKRKLQQESLAHKRKALTLRREGNIEAADAEFELAKSIEKQMEELESSGETSHGLMPNPSLSGDINDIDDIFDPHLLAALKGLGFNGSDMMMLDVAPRVEQEVKEKKSNIMPRRNPVDKNVEREQLERKIKAEKLRAVHLKREGRQSEALDALRGAKQLEKKLQLLL